jgi:hypothetical protein
MGELVVGGCYDGSVHGFRRGADGRFELVFAYKSHLSCVKCVAAGGAWLASGGTDEVVRVYALGRLQEAAELLEHTDTVLSLAFIGARFLLSGGADGKICLWRTKDWNCVAQLRGHKPGPCTSIAAHPGGAVALSTSSDNSLRMWDLEAARPASRLKVDGAKVLGLACWAPAGERFAVIADDRRALAFAVAAASGKPFASLALPARCNALLWLSDGELAAGLENGDLVVLDCDTAATVATMRCGARVRSLACMPGGLVAAGLSTGELQIWDRVTGIKEGELRVGSGAHLTCAVFASVPTGPGEAHQPPQPPQPPQQHKGAAPKPEKHAKAQKQATRETSKDAASPKAPSKRDMPEKPNKVGKGASKGAPASAAPAAVAPAVAARAAPAAAAVAPAAAAKPSKGAPAAAAKPSKVAVPEKAASKGAPAAAAKPSEGAPAAAAKPSRDAPAEAGKLTRAGKLAKAGKPAAAGKPASASNPAAAGKLAAAAGDHGKPAAAKADKRAAESGSNERPGKVRRGKH